jgi:hypothetical protein
VTPRQTVVPIAFYTIGALEVARPRTGIPSRYNDFLVSLSWLDDFRKAAEILKTSTEFI